jgi:hypothetical protein
MRMFEYSDFVLCNLCQDSNTKSQTTENTALTRILEFISSLLQYFLQMLGLVCHGILTLL